MAAALPDCSTQAFLVVVVVVIIRPYARGLLALKPRNKEPVRLQLGPAVRSARATRRGRASVKTHGVKTSRGSRRRDKERGRGTPAGQPCIDPGQEASRARAPPPTGARRRRRARSRSRAPSTSSTRRRARRERQRVLEQPELHLCERARAARPPPRAARLLRLRRRHRALLGAVDDPRARARRVELDVRTCRTAARSPSENRRPPPP